MEASGTPSQTRWLPRFLGLAAHAESSKQIKPLLLLPMQKIAEATSYTTQQRSRYVRSSDLISLEPGCGSGFLTSTIAASDKSQEVPSVVFRSCRQRGTLHSPLKHVTRLQESLPTEAAPEPAGHPEPGAEEQRSAFACGNSVKSLTVHVRTNPRPTHLSPYSTTLSLVSHSAGAEFPPFMCCPDLPLDPTPQSRINAY